jgi:serine/threonine protein kinase
MQDDLAGHAKGHELHETLANLCAAFAEAWKNGDCPRIESILDQVAESDRRLLLSQLVALEVDFRRERGEEPSAEEYLARFPDQRGLIDSVLFETEQIAPPEDSTREYRTGVIADGDADFILAAGASSIVSSELSAEGLNRYVRIALLGRGGFAEVWRARDSRLGREVAIKVPRPDKTFPPDIHARFLAEARKVAALDSIPGIVRVIDVSPNPADFHIVMQLIDGETLAERLADKTKPRPTHRETAQLIAELATALDEVHRHRDNITHRDLKPQNILLDARGRPHITDFGLAVSETEQLEEGPTQQGTKAYLSPEQARFESNLVDGRSDIFSLGVIFYEMLCAVRPFSGKSPQDCVKAIQHAAPRPLRARDSTIPKELERICLKCLEKRMADRYLTAGDLAEELRKWLNAGGDPAPSDSAAGSTDRQPEVPARRGRPIAVAAGALAVVVAGFALVHNWPASTEKSPGGSSGPSSPGLGVPAAPASRAEREFLAAFGRQPKLSSYEGKRGRGSHKFVDEPNLRALEISSESVWLIELREMPAGDFDFGIELRQPNWTGRVGVFFGKHVEEQGSRQLECDTFQLLWLHYRPAIPDIRPASFSLERQKVYIESPNPIPQTFAALELGTQAIAAPWEAAAPRLEFSIRNRRLARVSWNGEVMPEFVADVWETKLTADDYQGPLGIYVENSSVWCSKPVLKLVNEKDN